MEHDTRALTGVRGVAAISVMLYHLAPRRDDMLAAHFFSKGYLMVDLFFVLSGFVLALNHGAAFGAGEPSDLCGGFYRRRIARVYPLLLVTILLTLAYRALIGEAAPSPIVLLANLTMAQAWLALDNIVRAGWSVSVEAFAYLAFPWIAFFAFRASPKVLACVVLATWACLWWMTTLDPVTSFLEASANGPLDIYNGVGYPLLRGLCEFVAGICAYRLAQHPRAIALLSTGGFPEALVVAIGLLAYFTDLDVAVVALFVPFICTLAIPGHCCSRLLRSRLALSLGDLSYATYLSHILVGSVIRHVSPATMPALIIPVSSVLACLGLAALLHAFVERPCHALLRSHGKAIPKGWSAPAAA